MTTINEKAPQLADESIQFANKRLFSDVHPFEIVKKIGDKTAVIKALDAERDPNWKPNIVAGGFAGHCTNQYKQAWIFNKCDTAIEFKIRLHKDGWWRDPSGNKYFLSTEPKKFYDYNF